MRDSTTQCTKRRLHWMLKETSSALRITWRSVKHAKAVCTLIAPLVVNTLCSRQSWKHQYTMYQTLRNDDPTKTTRHGCRWSNALQQKLPTKCFKQSAQQECPQSILREALKANIEAQKLVRVKPTCFFFLFLGFLHLCPVPDPNGTYVGLAVLSTTQCSLHTH